jgi:hypothetical protein
VPGPAGLSVGTLQSIFRQRDVRQDDFLNALQP